MAIKNLVTRGFVFGPIARLVTMGYDISTIIPSVIPTSSGLVGDQSTGNGIMSNQSTGAGILSNQTAGASLTGRGKL